jgi:hypothetical protein
VLLEFMRAGVRGTIDASLDRVDDPAAVGKPAGTEGFPYCRALVHYPSRGYDALFGWVQLVRSTDAGSEFAIDPLRFFEDSSAPHCFYGFCPTLFDAPSRDERTAIEWIAHSFLTPIDLFSELRDVHPVAGFSWGFEIDPASGISVRPLQPLRPSDWELHREYLGRQFPRWRFLAANLSGATAWIGTPSG